MAGVSAAVVETRPQAPSAAEASRRRQGPQAARTRRGVEDPHFFATLLGLLHESRWEAVRRIGASLRDQGVDPTVCEFLADDLMEAVDALADLEAFVQEVVESLDRPGPVPQVLGERAADVAPQARADHLHLTLGNLRRRLVQVAARLAHRPAPA